MVDGAGIVEVAGGRVTSLAARSPLRLIAPKNHGRAAWIYTSSLGGGLVDGDRVHLRVRVDRGAAAFLTSQAASRVYPGQAAQEIEADIDGLLVHAPDPVVCHTGAAYHQRATCRLGPDASLVWVEALTAGRVERGERWAFTRYQSQLRVERAGRLLLTDGLLLDHAHGDVGARLGRFTAVATLVALGPEAAALRSAWLAPAPIARGAEVVAAPSPLGPDGVLVRIAAVSPAALRADLRTRLAPLAALLGDDPLARKW